MVDVGVFPGNYHEYESDEMAVQRTKEIVRDLKDKFCSWEDPSFPHDARSLFFDPLNPPKGSMPDKALSWNSICKGEVDGCLKPVFHTNNPVKSAIIDQGSLGDNYFINALRTIACRPACVRRLIVTEEFANRGVYTFKFFKSGRWRYVHIDDGIPSRKSGRVHYCRNSDPNETFAMLLEKAYAKLHGCYEAIAYGLLEKALHDLTSGAPLTLRAESMLAEDVCNVYFETLQKAMEEKHLAVCGRWVPDPYSEHNLDRKGVLLDTIYQIVDVGVYSAEATAELGALTVGMICVRNVTRSMGRWTGRWCYGDKLWGYYNDLSTKVTYRTKMIAYERGMSPHPGPWSSFQDDVADNVVFPLDGSEKYFHNDVSPYRDEPDSLSLDFVLSQGRSIVKVQPDIRDLHWIQIEDFVELFNRCIVVRDMVTSEEQTYSSRSFVSKWIPGDYIGGSGGPPMVNVYGDNDEPEELAPLEEEEEDEEAQKNKGLKEYEIMSDKEDIYGEKTKGKELSAEEDEQGGGDDDDDEEEKEENLPILQKVRKVVNPNFADNPIWPITIHEAGEVQISLYQPDKRWNCGRFGDVPRDMAAVSFANRHERLGACMKYPIGIGFVVCRLYGLKHRVTVFKTRKLMYACNDMEFSNVVTHVINFTTGRFAIIPYTNLPVSKALSYCINFKYKVGAIEFEIEDILKERAIDDEASGDDTESDSDDDSTDEDDDEETIRLRRERRRVKKDAKDKALLEGPQVRVPMPLEIEEWEWSEEHTDFSISTMYEEAADLAKQLAGMRRQMQSIVEVQNIINKEKEEADKKAAEEAAIRPSSRQIAKERAAAAEKAGSPGKPRSPSKT